MSFDHLDFTPPMQSNPLPYPVIVADTAGIASGLLLADVHLAPMGDSRGGPATAPTDGAFANLLRTFAGRGDAAGLAPPFEFLLGGGEEVTLASTEGDPDGDDDGDGIPNKDDPDSIIVVTGTRPRVYDPDPGSDIGGGSGDSGGTQPPSDQELDCRDRAALSAQSEINQENDDAVDEHASIVYVGSDGKVHRSPPIEGDTLGVPMTAILEWMSQNGVSMSQVIGLVHNHPLYEYGTTDQAAAINRYPSGGDVKGGDWNAASYMVNNGAGGTTGANFAMYVIDTAGQMREFLYSDRAKYENLSADEREQGDELPEQMKSDGSSCG